MKLRKFLRTTLCPLIVILAFAGLQSCTKEEPLNLIGSDCSIVSMNLKSGDKVLHAQVFPDSILVVADYNLDMTEMTAEFELSEGAIVDPDMSTIRDWSKPMSFTVTAADCNSQKVYYYNVRREALESYYNESVYLRTQEEVNAFGENNYRRVRSIIVCDNEENQITDLTALNSIYKVDNNFTVKGFHGETIALDNLKEVSTLDVNARSLVNISAPELKEINNLYIGYISEEEPSGEIIDSLANFNFSSLKKIKGNFILKFFNRNPEFAINGFDNLESIDGDIIFAYPTAHFKTFSKITKVKNLQIGNRVKSFEGLQNIKEVTGVFCTNFLSVAETLLPFAPEKIHTVQLMNCQQFNNLEFCKNLTKVYDFEIGGAFRLESLKGLENLREIEHGLFISYTRLKNLDELSNLERIGSIIKLYSNNMLEDYSGLKKCLENFDGEWIVERNRKNPTIDEILGK